MPLYPSSSTVAGPRGAIQFAKSDDGPLNQAGSPLLIWDNDNRRLLLGDPVNLLEVEIHSPPVGDNANGLPISIIGGDGGAVSGDGASIFVGGGDAPLDGDGGGIGINGGDARGAAKQGGEISITSGSSLDSGPAGDVRLNGGTTVAGPAGNITLQGGRSSGEGNGGSINITAGNGGFTGDGDGGDINLYVGFGVGTGRDGLIIINGVIPTADPLVAGAVWNDAGALKISAG